MRKIRSDSIWLKLTPEQQKKIEHWFFVEPVSYRAIRERMRTEFGVTCALSGISAMYQHCREMRSKEREAVMDRLSEYLVEPGAQLERVRPEALTVISGRLMCRALKQDDIKTVSAMGRLMVQSEGNEIAKRKMDVDLERAELEGQMLARKAGTDRLKQFLAALAGKNSDLEPKNGGS